MPPGAQREQLLAMAGDWEQMAVDRVELIRTHPELAVPGERAEEGLDAPS
jgi:hypothetical protein